MPDDGVVYYEDGGVEVDGYELPQVVVPVSVMSDDWTKVTWDLPPYKSPEFLDALGTMTLDEFRRLPVYRFAVKQRLIVRDRWMGKAGRRWAK